ncbi:MAG: hypothetical protein K2Y40_04590 [Reyranella sp.]|jgi:hypothetical protein|nr:hypothetical protein [Reyranella sp.]
MIKKLSQAAILVAGLLAVGGCTLNQAQTAAPVAKAAAPDYQAPVPPNPPAANIRAICYNAADLAVVRARMVQQELVVATLQCQNPGGSRAFEALYGSFIRKYQAELNTNARAISEVARRKRLNVDVFVTEVANRTAQRAPADREFCSRNKRALDWALDPKATSLAQVPPPYDLGPEMNIFPCPAQ